MRFLFCFFLGSVLAYSSHAADSTNELRRLILRRTSQFPQISPSEQNLLDAVANGEVADYSEGNATENKPADAAGWRDRRIVRAKVIEWLCTDKEASALVSRQGIRIKGARIEARIDLTNAKVGFPLILENCAAPGGIDLSDSEMQSVELIGVHAGPIKANSSTIHSALSIDDTSVTSNEVQILYARVGSLSCVKSSFANPAGKALSADGLKVDGSVFLDGLEAHGEVRFPNADVDGVFQAIGAKLDNELGLALNASELRVRGSLMLASNVVSSGGIRLSGSVIGGHLNCEGCIVTNTAGDAINADGVTISGSVWMRSGFRSRGEIRLTYAKIHRNFDCSSAVLENVGKRALNAESLEVFGNVLLRPSFVSRGEVNLVNGVVHGNFLCDGSTFDNGSNYAIVAQRLNVGGIVGMYGGV
jgi:hypothetical protein